MKEKRKQLKFGLGSAEQNTVPPAERPDSSEPICCKTVLDALRAVAAEGSTVCPVGIDRADALLRAGYRVCEEGGDVAIARGGESEFAVARKKRCRKLILCPTHAYYAALCPRYRTLDDRFAVMVQGKSPAAAVFDETDIHENLASVFGETVSLDLAAFDLEFGALMRGERRYDDVCRQAGEIISELTATLKNREKDRAFAAKTLVAAGEKTAKLVMRYPELLHASGAAQTAEALRMLYAAEDRTLGMRGETEMLIGLYVLDFYIKNLPERTEMTFPPDNGKHIDGLCEYLGADVRKACVYASPVYPPERMRLCEYRKREFRSEIAEKLTAIRKRQTDAVRVFKRLYADDGFGLSKLIDKTDIGLCLALAPDVFAGDTMLSFLKQAGRLERYIV